MIDASRGIWIPETAEAVERAVRDHLAGVAPLERGLRLDIESRYRERNYWLREAARLLGAHLSIWKRAEMIEAEVKSYPIRASSIAASTGTDPQAWCRRCIARAFETGINPPTSAKGIHAVIK